MLIGLPREWTFLGAEVIEGILAQRGDRQLVHFAARLLYY